ncbi:DUF4214 domain-containing protein [Pseudomonas syringae]|uniref:DUF4214 domain-containing protein n=1 Tax=Pseudomonas syringae TaxID=317 RepID=A0A085VNY3_PSESX|nr:DUF4214 domain-containing protein [Pseudomonas syringae]KFE57146.1 hypothetical protein IV01_05565 [Pseudomonas syringae]
MAASTYFDQVQQLYIAYFGRPADTVGQAFWATQIDAANGSIASVIAGFSASAESVALFGSATSAQKVTAIYQNAFGRAPEAAGLAFWVAQLDSGKVSQAQASWTIQQAAGPGDASAVNNKLIAAKAFTAQIDTNAEITGYNGAAAAALARAYLSKADATYASIANVAVDSVAAVGTATGTVVVTPPTTPVIPAAFTATVTNHVTTFAGTATGDISVAWAGAVNASDATFTRGGNVSTPVTFSNLGATSVSLASPEVLTGSVATLVGLTVSGTGGVKLTDTAVALSAKAFAANTSTDVLTVSTSAATATSLANLTGFEAIHLAGSTAVVTVANGAGTVVDTSAAARVTLGSGGQTFNGSTGDDTVVGGTGTDVISAGTGSNTLTGGNGNDTFNIAGNDTVSDLNTGDVLNILNTGVLNIGDVSAFVATALTANAGSAVINAAIGGGLIDLSLATGTNGFTLYGSIGNDTVIGSAKADIISGGLGVNTLTGGLGNDTFSSAGTDTITDLTTGDVLNVVASGITTANNVSAFVATASTSNAGTATLNASAAGSTIDMALATGANGFNIVGGTGNDIITGSVRADVLTGAGGANLLTGGLGTDTFTFITSGSSTATVFSNITDFASGTDSIKTGAGVTSLNQDGTYTAVGNGGTVATNITAAVTAGNTAASHTAAANDAYRVTITGTGAANYIFQDTDGDGVVGANELVIQLTGSSSSILAAADFVV